MDFSSASGSGNPRVSREYHVSVSGDDANSGAPADPLRSISAAAQLAMPGDEVVIHAGVYRERVDPPRGGSSETCRITYRSAGDGVVEIKGSEVAEGWVPAERGSWTLRVPNALFGDFHPYRTLLRGHWFLNQGRDHHSGAVYLNGHWLSESASLEELMNSGEDAMVWFATVDSDATTFHARFGGADPGGQTVEIAVRQTVFYPARTGCDFITVRGLKLLHAATPWSPPTTEQIGLIGVNWSKGWIIEDCFVGYSACAGITLGKYHDPEDHPELDTVEGTAGQDTYHGTIYRALAQGWDLERIGGHIVRNNTVCHCEMAGICGSLAPLRCLIEGNVIHDIHVRRQFAGFEQAGIKFHAAVDTEIRGNRIFRCHRGMWLDWMAQGTRVTGNLFYDNGPEPDLFVEVSHGPFVVDNNIFLSAKSVSSWSHGGAYLFNLFMGSFDARAETGRLTPHLQPHSTQVVDMKSIALGDDRFIGNIFAGGKGTGDYDAATEPVRIEDNLYLGQAAPSKHDVRARVLADSNVEVVRNGSGFLLQFPDGDAGRCAAVSAERLGLNVAGNLPFEHPDGSPFRVAGDFTGNPRGAEPSGIGPFAAGFPRSIAL